jgi:hypothetical protein
MKMFLGRFGLVVTASFSIALADHAWGQAPISLPPFMMPPPPRPEMPVPAPPAPPPLAVRSNGNVAANLVPRVEVWHNTSTGPQTPNLHGRHFQTVYLIETQKATVRLKFPSGAAGTVVVIKAGPGVTLDPPQAQLQIGPGGQCVISLALDSTFAQSNIEIYYLGSRTRLPLSRASAATVAAAEARTGGRP